jgi:hypothetical protein
MQTGLSYVCLEAPDLLPYLTREEADQLGLDGCKIGTICSDYEEFVEEFRAEFDIPRAGSVTCAPLGAN